MRQIILKTDTPNQFLLYWVNSSGIEIPNSRISLDFNPSIIACGLKQNFCLVHYQAKPLFLRRFGVFCEGKYFSVDGIEAHCFSKTLTLSETNLTAPPNAVIVYPNSQLRIEDDVAFIKSI